MSLRNIQHSQDLRYNHGHTPRKARTVTYSDQFQPTHFYRKQIYIPSKNEKQSEWVGKYFLPIGSTNNCIPSCMVISEHDVRRHAGMYSYRVLYADVSNGQIHIQSKAAMEGRPGQLNLIMDTNNKILKVEYW